MSLLWLKALIFILGFPLLIVILGEVISRLEPRGNIRLVRFLNSLRSFVFPCLAIWLVMNQFLGFPHDSIFLRLLETLIWLGVIFAGILLLGILLTTEQNPTSWHLFKVPRLFLQIIRILFFLGITTYILSSLWQVDLSNIAAALGVGSVVIALALQSTLSNLVSGFLLLFDSPFKVGDWIRFGDIEGQVVDLNWRSVRLRTLNRELLIVPNGVLDQQNIFNYHSGDRVHGERFKIGFSYDDAPNFVQRVIKSAAIATKGILSDPAPDVFTMSYDDFAITYEVKYFIDDFQNVEEIRNDFRTRIFYAAKRNGLTIPFPIRTLQHVRIRTPQREERVQEIAIFLQSLPFFAFLESEAIAKLADVAILQFYGLGDEVISEGIPDPGFYIIEEGAIKLLVTDLYGSQQEVIHLSREDFFGETALLPGENSQVTGVVTQDLTVLVFEREAIATLMAGSARFARQINQFIEERKKRIEQAHQASDRLNSASSSSELNNSKKSFKHTRLT
ncbi:mechanosensitive ion channel family protein [Kamptonema animale CS-326]|jgi:small-conductance mechanosensitive channel/CRP-like cAMP-binding protein|uniref:mechanosensitive ion channel family protein n=1 Tax=Kamptonema animale TaxID=92934 RepID=UPI0023306B90|nr:mechanosensitive ion channel family protein [Kamptonema animale]MDB9509957.1 mechanosensitive ion channel family protein [Kamptonema animale CS-326]